jgi:2,3-bisphosphoglycerate-independent phosphoglycerate mutase
MTKTNSKLLIFLIDGLGDVAISKLNYKTPLQQAHTPWLDKLAGNTKKKSFLS